MNTVPTLAPGEQPATSLHRFFFHADLDQPFAVFLGEGLAAGEHTIVVEIVEQGDPWENTRTYTWTFSVNPPASSAE